MQLPTTWSDTHASTSSHLCHTKEHGIAALPCRARDVGMARLWHGMVWHACMRGWEWMVWSSTSRLIMLFDFTDGIISSWMVGYIFQEYSILILYNSMWEKKMLNHAVQDRGGSCVSNSILLVILQTKHRMVPSWTIRHNQAKKICTILCNQPNIYSLRPKIASYLG